MKLADLIRKGSLTELGNYCCSNSSNCSCSNTLKGSQSVASTHIKKINKSSSSSNCSYTPPLNGEDKAGAHKPAATATTATPATNPTSFHDAGIDIQKMPLSEFGKAGITLKIWSEVLQEHVYYISNEEAITRHKLDAVTYSATELSKMLDMSPEELKAVHEVKRLFHKGRVIAHHKENIISC